MNVSLAIAIFAGGCFWCVESDFEKLKGVSEVSAGYIDGKEVNPTYKEVSSGLTGHTEAVKITYDPNLISYQQLLEHFWININPSQKNAQFCDVGTQYRSGIYYLDDTQKNLANESLKKVQKKFANVYTEIKKAKTFYPAEDYHQNYYKKNPLRYKFYRLSCGRDKTLKKLWQGIKLSDIK